MRCTMLPEKMEQGFEQNLKAIQLLQNALGTSFLEAYVENAENLIDNYQVRVVDGVPSEEIKQQISALYKELSQLSFEPEEWRRLSQLLLLKGSQTEHLQANDEQGRQNNRCDFRGFLVVDCRGDHFDCNF